MGLPDRDIFFVLYSDQNERYCFEVNMELLNKFELNSKTFTYFVLNFLSSLWFQTILMIFYRDYTI